MRSRALPANQHIQPSFQAIHQPRELSHRNLNALLNLDAILAVVFSTDVTISSTRSPARVSSGSHRCRRVELLSLAPHNVARLHKVIGNHIDLRRDLNQPMCLIDQRQRLGMTSSAIVSSASSSLWPHRGHDNTIACISIDTATMPTKNISHREFPDEIESSHPAATYT